MSRKVKVEQDTRVAMDTSNSELFHQVTISSREGCDSSCV